MKLEDLDKLNIIHIAGTKGKGTTAAYTSSILSQYCRAEVGPTANLRRIGLFTSPHLVSVRERIQINNAPVSNEMFTAYFSDIWRVLSRSPIVPTYFRFLTLLSYHIFLHEGVDIAVYETGVEGNLIAQI